MMSIVRSIGTFVNNDVTSSETGFCSLLRVVFLIHSRNSSLDLTIWLELRKGLIGLLRYWAT